MRFRHPDGSIVHLAYCTNVHAAETFDGIVANLDRFAEPIRRRLDWETIGLGLWLAAPLAHELARDRRLVESLKAELNCRQIEVVTLNGFPYQAFQADVVKGAVYRPNWTETERLDFTLDLAKVLHQMLPDDAEDGSVSTLPLGWRDIDVSAAVKGMEQLAEGLEKLATENGRAVRVAVEPEPGCVVETIDQAIDVLSGLAPELIGLCLDACHLAVQFEDPVGAVKRLNDAGVRVVKSQVSSALRVRTPANSQWLEEFVEPRFLHQTRQRVDGGVRGVDDLDEAFGTLDLDNEWRVHFHVPVHQGGERTTQEVLSETLDALVGGDSPVTRHLEVETYTWSVLPAELRPVDDEGLVEGIAREMSWTAERLLNIGLEGIE